jgi:hypothetical protein
MLELVPSGKSVVYEVPAVCQEAFCMSHTSSELVEISKLNGDFRKNYGKLLGANLYLRSISAARRQSFFWISLLFSGALAWLGRHGLSWLFAE